MNKLLVYIDNIRKLLIRCNEGRFYTSKFRFGKTLKNCVLFLMLWMLGIQQGWGQYYMFDYNINVTNFTSSSPMSSLYLVYNIYQENLFLPSGQSSTFSGSKQIPLDQATYVDLLKIQKFSDLGIQAVDGVYYYQPLNLNSSPGYNTIINGMASPGNISVSGSYQLYPVLVDALTQSSRDLLLTSKVSASIPNKFPSCVYHWEMMVNGGGWQPLPSKFQGFSQISFSAADLSPNLKINDVVILRINPCDLVKSMSNVITFTVVASPPVITLTNPTGPKCAGSSDGSIIVNLVDRKLEPNEILHLQDDDALFTIDIKPENINTNLLYSFKIPQGTRNLTYYSTFVTSGIPGYCNTTLQDIGSVTIPNAPSSASFTAIPTDVICHGDKGSISLSAKDGTAPYTYTIDGGNQGTLANQSAIATIKGLAPGDHTVAVTDYNNCPSSSQTITIADAIAVTASISGHTDNTCKGGSTGAISVEVSGGNGGYTYVLFKDGAQYKAGDLPSDKTFSGLPAGNYRVEISDAKSCSTSWSGSPDHTSISITEPDAVSFTASPKDIT
ncbi:MAG: SprB repeat-containing protein, partial [Bacteroidota bacterium]|nr:SprB repeat-containing protein [Bacteroidota bacterium]